MELMFSEGFLGTKAPLFMDVVTLIVAFLPLLVFGGITLARKRVYFLHMLVQNIIFFISVVVVAYFELGVRVGGGFNAFMQESGVSYNYALIVLVLHIIIATLTLFYWSYTIISGNYHYFKNCFQESFHVDIKRWHKKHFLELFLHHLVGYGFICCCLCFRDEEW